MTQQLPAIGEEVPQQLSALPPVGAEIPATTPAATFRSTNEKDAAGNAVVRDEEGNYKDPRAIFAEKFGAAVSELKSLNPAEINRFVQSAFWHPIDTAKGMYAGRKALSDAAIAAFHKGDAVTGVAKTIEWLMPFVGERLSQAGDQMQAGDVAGGIGATVDAAAPFILPKVASALPERLGGVARPIVESRLNPKEAAAVAFGEERGIPLDAATKTGSPTLRAIEKRVANSMGGEGTAERLISQQEHALTRVGGELADEASPKASTPELAGRRVTSAIQREVQSQDAAANTAYDALREIEADPKHTHMVPVKVEGTVNGSPVKVTQMQPMALPVDLRASKAALRPIYEQLIRQYPITQQQSSFGLKALENVVNGPDYAPLSQVDRDLSALKSLARGAEMPELRNMAQGNAAAAVKALDTAVRETARRAGSEATQALKRGRAATIAKYKAADILEGLRDEPVQVYRQATAPKDSGIVQLRAIARLAPNELPHVARAYLDDLLSTATSEGGFERAAKLQAEWQKLGTETKRLLFPKAGQVQALDHFFLLAKRIGENPNPSGTAHTMTATNVLSSLAGYPLAQVLYTKRGVDALTRVVALDLKAPGSVSGAARTAAWLELGRAARDAGVNVTLPKAAGPSDSTGSP